MAPITNIRIWGFALTAAALLTLGMHIPAVGSAVARNYVEPAATTQTEAVDPPGIYGADPEFTAVIESAIDRFNSVGLTLPELRIYYQSDRSGCLDAIGLFSLDGSGSRVDLCTQVTYTLLRELAHAWEYHTMDDATRQGTWTTPDWPLGLTRTSTGRTVGSSVPHGP